MLDAAGALLPRCDEVAIAALHVFMRERLAYVLEERGFDQRNVRAVMHLPIRELSPLEALRKLQALSEFTASEQFQQLALAFKRVRNIAKTLSLEDLAKAEAAFPDIDQWITEPAERALMQEISQRAPVIAALMVVEDYRKALAEASQFEPAVSRFFKDVLVMSNDFMVSTARLRLLRRLEALILELADISQIVAEEK